MNHKDILAESVKLLRNRNKQFGSEEDVLSRALVIFHSMTGIELSLYEGAIFLHAYEAARMKNNRKSLSNVYNGIDYLALSGQFAAVERKIPFDEVEDDILKTVTRLSSEVRPSFPLRSNVDEEK
jgi:hypothetical protein